MEKYYHKYLRTSFLFFKKKVNKELFSQVKKQFLTYCCWNYFNLYIALSNVIIPQSKKIKHFKLEKKKKIVYEVDFELCRKLETSYMYCPNLDTIWQILEIQLQKQILLHPTRSTCLLDVCLENLHPFNSPKLFIMKAKLVPPYLQTHK